MTAVAAAVVRTAGSTEAGLVAVVGGFVASAERVFEFAITYSKAHGIFK